MDVIKVIEKYFCNYKNNFKITKQIFCYTKKLIFKTIHIIMFITISKYNTLKKIIYLKIVMTSIHYHE